MPRLKRRILLPNNVNEFANWLTEQIEINKTDIHEIKRRTGIPYSRLYSFTHARYWPSLGEVVKIFYAMGYSLELKIKEEE